jgi:hypothetical protein
VTCDWDFGDGSIFGPGSDPFHTFVAPGVYTVCVVVTDDEGGIAECCERIAIGPGEQLCFTLEGNCWHMITVPCYAVNPDPWEVFDELRPPGKPSDLLSGNLHRYNRDPDKYVTYQHFAPGEFGPIGPGHGYWLWLFEDATICYECVCSGQPESVRFRYAGWYMTGSPQPTDCPIGDTTWYQGAVGPQLFGDIMNVWVQDPLVGYRCLPLPSGYYNMGLLPTDEDDHLRQCRGYWMYAFEPDVTMEVPPP